jgi:hypothetical protein
MTTSDPPAADPGLPVLLRPEGDGGWDRRPLAGMGRAGGPPAPG